MQEIQSQEQWVLFRLEKFYSNSTNLSIIKNILDGNSRLSLRLIDWFVTNYSKYHNISYIHKGQDFFVYIDYKNQLKAYSKKLFDPFCRRERILFQLTKTSPASTSLSTSRREANPLSLKYLLIRIGYSISTVFYFKI
jgi:hypothetical protein